MTTFTDWVEKVYRRVNGTGIDVVIQLAAGLDSNDTTFQALVTGSGSNAVRPGALLACEYENMLVTAWDPGTSTVTAIRGYNGSTAVPHVASTAVYVQPRYSRFDISVALNDELLRLSSPDKGLFQVKADSITYNPVYMGYDLTQLVNDNYIDVMSVNYKIPYPSRNYPAIHRWEVKRSIPDTTVFPSSQALVLYENAYPGLPVYVQYSAAFTTVDLTNPASFSTDVTTLTGLTPTMVDIPPLGVQIDLTLPREIRRNFTDVQPDPRKAPEVPPGAISNSATALLLQYEQRVSEEAGRLSRQYTRTRGW